jgi:hypothetical protein
MAKNYRALMAERRAKGGVPQIDPDDAVTIAQPEPQPTPVDSQAQPTSVAAPHDPRRAPVDPAEPKAFSAFRLPAIRGRQIKYEAADKGIREWEVVDRALDLYFKTHYIHQKVSNSCVHDTSITIACWKHYNYDDRDLVS